MAMNDKQHKELMKMEEKIAQWVEETYHEAEDMPAGTAFEMGRDLERSIHSLREKTYARIGL